MSALEKLMPYKALAKIKPRMDHFKVFGYLVFVVVGPQMRKKFNARSQKEVFIGYYENSKAYKILDPDTKRV